MIGVIVIEFVTVIAIAKAIAIATAIHIVPFLLKVLISEPASQTQTSYNSS